MRFIIVATLCLCIISCDSSNKKKIPNLYVQNFDTSLKKVNSQWYYKNDPLNGYLVEQSSDGKNILYQVPVIDGLEEGWAWVRYNSLEKLMIRYYRKGKVEGSFTKWWPNGNERYRFNYKHDKLDGKQMVFYPNGQKHQESNYADGNEEGIQRVWDEKGHLISNYTIKNKKLYGVVSVKSCIPEGHH